MKINDNGGIIRDRVLPAEDRRIETGRQTFLSKKDITNRAGFLDRFLSFLFPGHCLFCRDLLTVKAEYPLCSNCLPSYHPGGRVCPLCEGFFRGKAPCSCFERARPLQALFTIALYDHRWRRLVHDLKYRKRCQVARPLGFWLAREMAVQGYFRFDLVVPVPMHKIRHRERGYNQSALLARNVAKALNIPCREQLVKHRHTPSQTSLSRRIRHEHLKGVFRCKPGLAPGAAVLLVDDVYSTGATMKEAASVLQRQGVKVFGAVVAYNPDTISLKQSGFYAGLDRW